MKKKSVKNGILMAGGINVPSLVKKYGSPLYVYDLKIIREQYQALRQAIPEKVQIFYAIKANPNPNICSFIRLLGAGAEIASSGELYIALKSGFKGKDIVYNGPGKTDEDIEYAINNGVHIINVESLDELQRINFIATHKQQSVKIGIRINPIRSVTQVKMQTGGGSQKFGTDEEDIETIIKAALKFESIELQGIHIYVGSQILESEVLLENIENTLKIAFNAAKKFGLPLKYINFGGGLGVPYNESEPEFDVEKFGNGLTALISKVETKSDNISFILELGRFLVSEAGMFLTKVISVKKSRGKKYVIVDGGINHAFLPIRMNKNYPIFLANKMDCTDFKDNFIVGGPLCTSMDVFTNEVKLPPVEMNDIICIGNSGAYGFSASMLYFLSAPMPAEVIVENGKSFIARQRGKKEDFLLNCEIVV
jgi:diaminopimelate decarboxylase